MSMLRKILVPVDFSEAAQAAERAAEQLAHTASAELILLHVVDDAPLMLMDGAGYMPVNPLGRYEEAAQARLDESLQHAVAASVPARASLARGKPEQVIVRTAEEQGVDLIVMGTHGRKGFQRFLLGSVAERVVRTSTVPVLTVRGEERAAPAL